jgi:hypothetical protein
VFVGGPHPFFFLDLAIRQLDNQFFPFFPRVTMIDVIRRFGVQFLFIALCIACGGSGGNYGGGGQPEKEKPYTGPVEGQIPEQERMEICQEYSADRRTAKDEAEVAYPNVSETNLIVKNFIIRRRSIRGDAMIKRRGITIDQLANILNEGVFRKWWTSYDGDCLETVVTPTSKAYAAKLAKEYEDSIRAQTEEAAKARHMASQQSSPKTVPKR